MEISFLIFVSPLIYRNFWKYNHETSNNEKNISENISRFLIPDKAKSEQQLFLFFKKM